MNVEYNGIFMVVSHAGANHWCTSHGDAKTKEASCDE